MKKYFILIILSCLLFLGVKVAFGGEMLRYQADTFQYFDYAVTNWKVVSNQNNQYVKKITIFYQWYYGNGTLPSYMLISKYNSSNQLVSTSTSVIQVSSDNTFYPLQSFDVFPNLNLNQGEYIVLTFQGGIDWSFKGWWANYDIFNHQYFNAYITTCYAGCYTNNNALLKIYTLTPDNPQVYQFTPSNGSSFGSNFFSLNFTSSTPLSFYVSNAQDLKFNFYIKDYLHKDFDYQFSITIPLSLAQSTNKFDFDFKNLQVRINNGSWFDFSQYTGFQDNAYFGDVFIKVEAVNLLNNLTGSGIVQYKFPDFSGGVSEESLGLFFYNADDGSGLTPFYDCGAPSNSSTTPETFNVNRLKIEVFSCGLVSGQSYQLKFVLINTTDNNILFQDFQNYFNDFKYSQNFTLETNKLYKVLYWLYRGGVLVYNREVWFQISQITSPFLTFNTFYSEKIQGFGFSATTTPSSFANYLGNLLESFLIIPSFKIPTINANESALAIANSINLLVANIKTLSFIPSWFLITIFGLMGFIIFYSLIKKFFLR